MKLYNKIGLLALALAGMTSCAVNDPFADNMEIGQMLPTVSWSLGSSNCKAGQDANFKGNYYFKGKDEMIDHSEVWAMTTRSESAAATCKLAPALGYTMTVSQNDTVRSSNMVKRFEHSNLEWNTDKTLGVFNKTYTADGMFEDANGKYNAEYYVQWDGYEYVLTGSFPTSQTLAPVSWASPKTWDAEKFEQLYPSNFKADFNAKVVDYLTKDSTYYTSLRQVYIGYDFTKDQFDALNAKYGFAFPDETGSDKKSDAWYVNTEKVVGKYYINVVAGVSYYVEVPVDATVEGVTLYDVYDSAPWVFCRYSDDTGAVMTSVRPKYMPFFKEMMELIPFEGWIYNSSEQSYTVTFSRDYKLIPQFKVYDKNNKVGVNTDDKEIGLN